MVPRTDLRSNALRARRVHWPGILGALVWQCLWIWLLHGTPLAPVKHAESAPVPVWLRQPSLAARPVLPSVPTPGPPRQSPPPARLDVTQGQAAAPPASGAAPAITHPALEGAPAQVAPAQAAPVDATLPEGARSSPAPAQQESRPLPADPGVVGGHLPEDPLRGAASRQAILDAARALEREVGRGPAPAGEGTPARSVGQRMAQRLAQAAPYTEFHATDGSTFIKMPDGQCMVVPPREAGGQLGTRLVRFTTPALDGRCPR